jgi:hypothetical protein
MRMRKVLILPALVVALALTGASVTGAGQPIVVGLINLANMVTGVLPKANGGAGDVTGLLKANGSGTVSQAVAGTDYASATSGSSLLKGNGSGGFSNAVSGTDYAPATSGTLPLFGNGLGGFTNGTIQGNTQKVVTYAGSAAATNDCAKFDANGNLTTAGAACGTGSGAGTVTNGATLTLGKTIVGNGGVDVTVSSLTAAVVKSAAGTLSAATSGTDYAPATSGSALLKGNGAGGFSSAASGTDYAPATSGSLPLFGDGSGGFSNGTVQGNTTKVTTYAGSAPATNDCAKFDANGNVTTAGAACGSGSTSPGGSNKDIQYNNSGAFGGIAPGTSGTVLTSNGAGSTPSFQAAAGGSSGLSDVLEQHTASSSSDLQFTSWYSSTYDHYIVDVVSLVPATNGTTIRLEWSVNGGSSYVNTGNAYLDSSYAASATGSGPTGTNFGQNFLYIGSGDGISNSASGWGVSGTFHIVSPGSALYKQFYGQGATYSSAGPVNVWMKGSLFNNSNPTNAFRVFAASGNLANGTVRVYGIKK